MPERTAAGRSLHRLRSALARVRGELDLLDLDGVPVSDALDAVDDAVEALGQAEEAVSDDVSAAPAEVQVVLLEDEPRLAELTARRLRRAGLQVSIASTLAQALQLAATGAVLVADLSALELHISDELAPKVRETRPIIVSGGAGSAAKRAAERFGAHAFFLKPVDPSALVVAISGRLAAAAP